MAPKTEWMTTTDERILELFGDADLVLTPEVVALNLTSAENYIESRMDELVASGLLEGVDENYYQLAPTGRRFLDGEASRSELQQDG